MVDQFLDRGESIMFNILKVLGFLGRILKFLTLNSLLILGLVLITEVLTQHPEQWDVKGFVQQIAITAFPFIAVIAMVYWLAGRFVRDLYCLENVKQGVGFLIRCRFGRLGFRPWLKLKQGKVGFDPDGILTKLGGPGSVIIEKDTAVVLERGGRLTRVEGPGFAALEPFETIYDIIDLRPKRRVYKIDAMTKEGILISWPVDVQYKIADNDQEPSAKVPHPFSREAIFQAATGTWRREIGRLQDMDWEGQIIISHTEGILRSILAQWSLDELTGPTETDRLDAREAIESELGQKLCQEAPKLGAKILQVKLDTLRVTDEVTEQWIQDWKDRWQQWSEDQLTYRKAKDIQIYEPKKAEAELMLIDALSSELQKLDSEQDIVSVVLMRLLAALGQAHIEGESNIFLPAEALGMLEKLEHFLDDHNGKIQQPSQARVSHTDPDKPQSISTTEEKTAATSNRLIIPIVGPVAAGEEMAVSDDVVGNIQQIGEFEFEIEGSLLKAKPLKGSRLTFLEEYDYFASQIVGGSMDKAGILPNDYVIFQKPKIASLKPSSGDIVAVKICDEDTKATLKQINFTAKDNHVILSPKSSNPIHQPRVLAKQQFAGDNPNVEVAAIAIAVLKPWDNLA